MRLSLVGILLVNFCLLSSACGTGPVPQTDLAASALSPSRKEIETRLEFLSRFDMASGADFKGTTVGGLSGAVYNPDTQTWAVISDDRGRKQEPRFYEFKITADPFKAEPVKVHYLHKKNQKRWEPNVLDCESITLLPWANYLIGSEGDLNRKPRIAPTLMDVKLDGTFARNFDLPEAMIPELAGAQTKGIQNNMGPEGLTSSEDRRFLWAAIEGTLVQDKALEPQRIRIVQYEMTEAWIIKPTKQFLYELEGPGTGELISVRGVSEIFWVRDQVLWVMERGLEVGLNGLNHNVKIYEVDLADVTTGFLKKKLILDAATLQRKLPNFEAMAEGPVLADGRKTLVLISDNNFQKGEPTQFWLLARNEKEVDVPGRKK